MKAKIFAIMVIALLILCHNTSTEKTVTTASASSSETFKPAIWMNKYCIVKPLKVCYGEFQM